MPQLMPYHLEKGPTIRLLEQHINGSAEDMRTMLDAMRASKGSLDWVETIPGLWADPRFAHSPLGSGGAVHDMLIQNWLGYVQDQVTGKWVLHTDPPYHTTGYWVAYEGDVSEIVRKTLLWALEQSLGLGPDDHGPGRDDPWEIEIFWKCPAPWFEGWVVTRPVDGRANDDGDGGEGLRTRTLGERRHRWHHWDGDDAAEAPRGLVTVIFMTPSHRGANVAESPIAHNAVTLPNPLDPNAHAVPSWQDDYEVLGEKYNPPLAGRPRVPAIDRAYSTWIVTHRNHVTAGVLDVNTNTATAADFADWGVPQVAIYRGREDIVIVSPSAPAGGVTYDGEI